MNKESTQEGAPGEYAVVRKVALELLCETEAGSRFVDEVLSEHIGRFERRDRHLLQEISYGALRHQNTLDRLLKFYVKLSMDRQRAPVRWALRLGAFQLVYLSRVPAHAAWLAGAVVGDRVGIVDTKRSRLRSRSPANR